MASGAGLGLWFVGGTPFALADANGTEAREISPVEDLIREHGALRRVLLIYDEIRRRLTAAAELPAGVVSAAANIIRRFVEEYHEKLEENELFPRFERAGRLVDLVKVLRLQHQAGRKVTATILSLATPESLNDPAFRGRLAESLDQFGRMYRPHAAREDTVLFPAFPALLPEKEYKELGEKFEDTEQQLFGKNGFENIVNQIADLGKTTRYL